MPGHCKSTWAKLVVVPTTLRAPDRAGKSAEEAFQGVLGQHQGTGWVCVLRAGWGSWYVSILGSISPHPWTQSDLHQPKGHTQSPISPDPTPIDYWQAPIDYYVCITPLPAWVSTHSSSYSRILTRSDRVSHPWWLPQRKPTSTTLIFSDLWHAPGPAASCLHWKFFFFWILTRKRMKWHGPKSPETIWAITFNAMR